MMMKMIVIHLFLDPEDQISFAAQVIITHDPCDIIHNHRYHHRHESADDDDLFLALEDKISGHFDGDCGDDNDHGDCDRHNDDTEL